MEPALAAAAAPTGLAEAPPRGLLRVGGATLARHQLALALAAGCKRIACLARGLGPDVIQLQHDAEAGGASFHLIAGAHGLSGLVTAADEVLVLTEGLLPASADALHLIEAGPAVLVQPAETGIPAGFERLDLNHAFAGIMLGPGRLVDRLMDLPPDVDPGSALLRIALQAGAAQRSVPDEILHSGRWLLVRSEAEAHAAEDSWIVRHMAAGPRSPGALLARAMVRHFGPAMLHGGNSPLAGIAAAGLLAALGLGAAAFGWSAIGLLLVGVGWVLCRASGLLDGLRREVLARPPARALIAGLDDMLFDLALVAILFLSAAVLPGQMAIERLFAPIMLLGLLRLAAAGAPRRGHAWAGDRLAIAVVLAAFALGRVLDAAVPLCAIGLLAGGLVVSRRSDGPGLTPA